MKQKDIPYFITNSRLQLIVTSKYIIQCAKIFYLFEDDPPAAGILDLQDLLLESDTAKKDKSPSIKYARGPIQFTNDNEFAIIY